MKYFSGRDDDDGPDTFVAPPLPRTVSPPAAPPRRLTSTTSTFPIVDLSPRKVVILGIAIFVLIMAIISLLAIDPFSRHAAANVQSASSAATATILATTSTYTPNVTPSNTPLPTNTPTYYSPSHPAPTNTPVPYESPTPAPTAPPGSTATPIPTATPNPYGASATVTFTKSATTIDVPQTLEACDGCSLSAANGTIESQYISDSINDVFGNSWKANTVNYSADPTLTMDCDVFFACAFSKGEKFTDYADNRSCTLNNSISWEGDITVGCSLTYAGYTCFNFVGITWNGNGGPAGDGQITAQSYGCGGGTYYTMPSGCANYGNNGANAKNDAEDKVLTYVNSHGLSDTLSGPSASITAFYCSDSRGVECNPGCTLPSYSGDLFYQRADATGYRYTYTAGDALTLQTDRLTDAVPNGYTGENFSVCSSPTINSVDLSAHTAQLTCAASGDAIWPWIAAQQIALQQGLVGMPHNQAVSTVNGWAGVQTGSASINISFNAPDMPTSYTAITLVINS